MAKKINPDLLPLISYVKSSTFKRNRTALITLISDRIYFTYVGVDQYISGLSTQAKLMFIIMILESEGR